MAAPNDNSPLPVVRHGSRFMDTAGRHYVWIDDPDLGGSVAIQICTKCDNGPINYLEKLCADCTHSK